MVAGRLWVSALVQVAMHSQHHRGQCMTRLKDFGCEPKNVDWMDHLALEAEAPGPVDLTLPGCLLPGRHGRTTREHLE